MLHIAVEREGQPRKELRFAKDAIVIGREADHDLQLAFEDGASRQHCKISSERGQFFVEDLGSRNGTKVNGKRIAGRTAITGRDEVEVGKVKIHLVDQAGAGAARATVRPAKAEPARQPAKATPEPAPARQPAKQPARQPEPEPLAPAKQPARSAAKPEPARPAKSAAKQPAKQPEPEPVEAAPADTSIKVNLRPAPAGEPEPEPEARPSGPVNDENEACRSQIDPLARRWRDLGRPASMLLHGPQLARGLAWTASDRKLRPRPSELHREFIYASRSDRRTRVRRLGTLAGAFVLSIGGGSLTARAVHEDLTLRDSAAGLDGGPGQCTPDNPTIVRADRLAQTASEQTDLELGILAGAHALAAADGPCARQSEAERVLRHALSRQRSRVIGRGASPVRAADVALGDRDVVSVDDNGAVILLDRSGASTPKQLTGGSGPGRVAALGPEGRWLAVGTTSGAVDLWDLSKRTDPKLHKQLESHRDPVTAIGFSEDGRFFASGDKRGMIRIWDMRGTDAGGGLGELRKHTGPIERLIFRDGGTRLYSFGGKLAVAWDLQDGRRKGKELPLSTGGDTTAFAVNGEGDEVVLGDSIGQVVRYKVRALKSAVSDTLAKHETAVVDLAFIPKERAVLSLGADKQLIVTELGQMMREGAEPLRVGLRGLAADPLALAADPTGRRIAVAAKDNKIYVWDVRQRHTSAQPVAVFDEHLDKIEAIRPTFDGNALISASADGTVRMWPLQSEGGGGALTVLSDHRGAVLGLGLSSDGARLLSVGEDKTVRAWRLDNRGAPRRVLEQTYTAPVPASAVALSPDGRWAAVGLDRQTLLYDLGATAGDNSARPIERSMHNDAIIHVGFSASEEWMVTADASGQINTWRMRKDGPEDSPASSPALGRRIDALALSPASAYFAVAAADYRVTLRPMTTTGGSGESLVVQHEKNVLGLAFSGGGDLLVSTSDDYRAILRKVDKGKVEEIAGRQAIAHDQRVRAAAFSFDKRWLATGSDDGVVVMTDLSRADSRGKQLKGHEGPVIALAFEPGSELLLSAGRDKTVRLWLLGDLDRGGEVRSIVLPGHGGPLTALRVDGSGRLFVTAGEDGQIRVWPLKHELLGILACRTVGRDFRDEEWATLYPGEPIASVCEKK